MPATIGVDCPHCGQKKMTCSVEGVARCRPNPAMSFDIFSISVRCKSCLRSFECLIDPRQMEIDPRVFVGRLNADGFDVTRYCGQIHTSPERPSPNALQYLDADIEETYTEAEENRIDRRIRSAATGYRTVLEMAMKKIAPDIKGNLFDRLGKLQDANKLPAEMTDWAHNIRILGNEAVHEGAKASLEDVEDLANITRIILIYLFEMPERVRLMRERKAE